MKQMTKYKKYLYYVIKHKWYVMLECFRIGLFWRGIVHDWHKFLPCEFIPYANYFYGKKGRGITHGRDKTGYYKPTDTGDSKFEMAWWHHIRLAKHHWQCWVVPEVPKDKLLEMPDLFVAEMICDWRGSGKAQKIISNNKFDWFEKNKSKMKLHPNSERKILKWLGKLSN